MINYSTAKNTPHTTHVTPSSFVVGKKNGYKNTTVARQTQGYFIIYNMLFREGSSVINVTRVCDLCYVICTP